MVAGMTASLYYNLPNIFLPDSIFIKGSNLIVIFLLDAKEETCILSNDWVKGRMRVKSLQNAIEYSKRLSEIQTHGQTIQSCLPDLLIEAPHPVFSVALSSDGALLAVGRQNGSLDVINLQTKAITKQFSATSPNGPESVLPIIAAKFGADNAHILAACCSGEIFSCNTDKGIKSEIAGSSKYSDVMSMDISPSNAPNIVAGYKDGTVRIFDIQSSKVRFNVQNSYLSQIDLLS